MRHALLSIAVASAIGFLAQRAPAGPCTKTLSVGDDVAAAVSSAADGALVCLNGGDYGSVNLFDIGRTGVVTLQSATGTSARMSPQVGNSSFITFSSMKLRDVLVNNCSTHIHFVNATFVAGAGGLLFTNNGYSCKPGDQDYLVDGASFDKVGQPGYEGRLSFVAVDGAVVKNSSFDGVAAASPADGIQILGGSTHVTIGPGNVFTGILESLCGNTHCDAIQDYGGGPGNVIKGNLFEDGDTFIMMPDGSASVTITDNIFDGSTSGYLDKIQLGSASDPVFEHNTAKDVRVSFDSKQGSPASKNALAQNNIMIGTSSWKTSGGNGCSGCTFRFNLFDDAGDASGTNNVIGAPVFVGGASPAMWAGWELAAGSPGKNAANDGLDMGALFHGGSGGGGASGAGGSAASGSGSGGNGASSAAAGGDGAGGGGSMPHGGSGCACALGEARETTSSLWVLGVAALGLTRARRRAGGLR